MPVDGASQRARIRSGLFSALDTFDRRGWEFVESDFWETTTHRNTRFSDEPETRHVELCEDLVAPLLYLRVQAPSSGDLALLEEGLRGSIAMESHTRVRDQVVAGVTPLLMYRLAYSAPLERSATTAAIVVAQFSHPEDAVAIAALEAAGIMAWRCFGEALREVASSSGGGVRAEMAERALLVVDDA